MVHTKNDCEDPIELISKALNDAKVEHFVYPARSERELKQKRDRERDPCGVSDRSYMIVLGDPRENQTKGVNLMKKMQLIFVDEARISGKRLVGHLLVLPERKAVSSGSASLSE